MAINIPFYEYNIQTTVTKDPNTVITWISETENQLLAINRSGRQPVIGLDIEWRPSFQRGVRSRPPAAVLQLCVNNRCLVFQIIHSPYIPHSLINFLNNPNYTFAGVGVNEDFNNLVENYAVGMGRQWEQGPNVVDLKWLAAQVYGEEIKQLGLKGIAGLVIGKEPDKEKRVTVSRWDDEWLTREQIEYASIDAFLSFEIARVLINRGANIYI